MMRVGKVQKSDCTLFALQKAAHSQAQNNRCAWISRVHTHTKMHGNQAHAQHCLLVCKHVKISAHTAKQMHGAQ